MFSRNKLKSFSNVITALKSLPLSTETTMTYRSY